VAAASVVGGLAVLALRERQPEPADTEAPLAREREDARVGV
jgi:hypothetical protein